MAQDGRCLARSPNRSLKKLPSDGWEKSAIRFRTDRRSQQASRRRNAAILPIATVILENRLRQALARLNPELPPEVLEDVYRKLTKADAPWRSNAIAPFTECWWTEQP